MSYMRLPQEQLRHGTDYVLRVKGHLCRGRQHRIREVLVCANVVGLMGPSLYLNFEITITFMLMAHYMGNSL